MVIKNGEWNIMLKFYDGQLLRINKGKVEHQKIRKCSMLHEPAENEM